MKNVPARAAKTVAAAASAALILGMASAANAAGDPASVAQRSSSTTAPHAAPNHNEYNPAAAPTRLFGAPNVLTRTPTSGAPVNLGQGSGIGHAIGR